MGTIEIGRIELNKPLALVALAASALTLAGCTQPSDATSIRTSRSVVAIGDSLSAASNSCDKNLACYDNSWATGSNPAVSSFASRLNATAKKPYAIQNYAVLGTKLDGLGDQLKKALEEKPAYLTLLIGGNDFCADTTQKMTSISRFRASFKKLTELVRQLSPGTKLIVASTPNPKVIYEAGKENPKARQAWLGGSICQSMLGQPLDTSAAAEARREQVVQRAAAFNRVLQKGCTTRCSFDEGAVNKLRLTASDISTVDYFHMSIAGQAKIAAAVWGKTLAPVTK